MLKSLVISLAKKYIISSLNDLLEKNKENVGYICGKINYWTTKLTVIIELLKKINARCSIFSIYVEMNLDYFQDICDDQYFLHICGDEP